MKNSNFSCNFVWKALAQKQRRIQNPVQDLTWNFFAKIVNDFQPVVIIAKSSV